MDGNGEEVDDQGSGWLEVKRKHRSSSKLSLQSWVGGFSGRSQCSLNDKGGNLHSKRKAQLPKAGGNVNVHGQHSVADSTLVSKVDEGGLCFPDTCVVKQDTKLPSLPITNSIGRIEDSLEVPQKIKPDVVQRIKWGDLEDDALVHHYEKTTGVDIIKFGDIENDNPVGYRKHENNSDLVCVGEENNLVTTSVNVDTDTLIIKDEVFEDLKEVDEISSKDIEVKVVNEKLVCIDDGISNHKEILTKHIQPMDNDKLTSSCQSSENPGMLVNIQAPVISMVGDIEVSGGTFANEDSSTLVVIQDTELLSSEKSMLENLEKSTLTLSVEDSQGLHDETIVHDSISKAQLISALGEGDRGETKERYRQRLWCFLFENLNRAVDELYLLCELECDVEQMKEAILVLEEAASDFRELNNRVEEFENVKRSSSQSIDGVPIPLKSDHRRPHALSWEVRRMTTSAHRADILSSSLEAFKKVQQERASMRSANDAKPLGHDCPNHHLISGDNLKKSARISTGTSKGKDSVIKSRNPSGGLDLTQMNLRGEKRNAESSKTSKINLVPIGRLPQHSSSSEVSTSRLFLKDSSAASVVGMSKREQVGCEAEKVFPKNNKILTDNIGEKNPKSTDHFKRQIPLLEKEKEKEKRNSGSWKSMDAWKEKRNWEDILSSPFRVSSRISHSPGMSRKSAERTRILHDKLMSPEKKKKTALDLKRDAEDKHARAMRIRSELETERVQKLQRTSEKLNRVNEWQAVRNMKLREGMYARHQRSESRHEAFLAKVVRRAGDESSKVNEVRFITSLNEENKKLMLRQKLQDSELRRAEKLLFIKTKQKEDIAREEAVLERKKIIEAEKLQRLAETQRKKEEAQVRREEERKASSAAREARAVEQLRRKEERAKAQQEEAELLAQKLAERLSESEQRRKFYLEQIRERASMDFRDQSSPLLRRSMNKEGQGRCTPTNSGEYSQENGVSSIGDSTAGGSTVTLHQSLKRRIKRIRQRLMALKFEFAEPLVGAENAGIGYRTAVGTARVKISRWLQELQRLRQARKEGAASIGLITAEMVKYLEEKDPELQASRQVGLLDFIASALPASHTSKPEACQVTIHLLKLLRVVLSAPANRSYFLAQNLLPPIIPMLSAALENYIKIAASLSLPGSTNSLSSKTSVENFESVSEILDGFLWTVTTIIGHTGSDKRQLQMWDGLLELLVAYQVVHRLRDLFALYDRPQVEGSPFPSSIRLSVYLLVVLTSRPGVQSSIDWEYFPIAAVLRNDNQEAAFVESANSEHSSLNNSSGDYRPPLSVINGSTVVSLPDVPEDRPLSIGNNCGKEPTGSSAEFNNADNSKVDVPDESQRILIEELIKPSAPQKAEKHTADIGGEQKNGNILNLKQPVDFLLYSLSETGLVSLPSLLTSVLLQANNKLSSEQAAYVLPSNFEEVATGVLKVLNNIALLDITFMQRMLARPDLKMEFFHLMSFLLSYCTSKWKVASDKVGLLLLECLLLLGHFALFHPGNQAVLRWGKSPTILHKVCDLPFVFFSDPFLMPVLAGTLVATCYGCEQNKGVVQLELSMDMLLSLLRSCRNVLPRAESNSNLDNFPTESSCDYNQLVPELKRHQVELSLKPSRNNVRNTRISLGKSGAPGNIRGGKMRSQREIKTTKPSEESVLKHNQPPSETSSMMLHCRFPNSFIDRAEQFFSAELCNVGDEI